MEELEGGVEESLYTWVKVVDGSEGEEVWRSWKVWLGRASMPG